MDQHRNNLLVALKGFAKFHLAEDPSAHVEYMDTSEELYARWTAAYVRRDWFLDQFDPEQRAALAEFDAYLRDATAKYNNLPTLLRFVTSNAGKEICARASALVALLEAP